MRFLSARAPPSTSRKRVADWWAELLAIAQRHAARPVPCPVGIDGNLRLAGALHPHLGGHEPVGRDPAAGWLVQLCRALGTMVPQTSTQPHSGDLWTWCRPCSGTPPASALGSSGLATSHPASRTTWRYLLPAKPGVDLPTLSDAGALSATTGDSCKHPQARGIALVAIRCAPTAPRRLHATDHLGMWSHYFRTVLGLSAPKSRQSKRNSWMSDSTYQFVVARSKDRRRVSRCYAEAHSTSLAEAQLELSLAKKRVSAVASADTAVRVTQIAEVFQDAHDSDAAWTMRQCARRLEPFQARPSHDYLLTDGTYALGRDAVRGRRLTSLTSSGRSPAAFLTSPRTHGKLILPRLITTLVNCPSTCACPPPRWPG